MDELLEKHKNEEEHKHVFEYMKNETERYDQMFKEIDEQEARIDECVDRIDKTIKHTNKFEDELEIMRKKNEIKLNKLE